MHTNTQPVVLAGSIAATANALVRFGASPKDGRKESAPTDQLLGHPQEEADRLRACRGAAVKSIASLTPRQKEILDLVLLGYPSKNIASDLRISQRTVENHRAAIAQKTRTKSLSALIHTAICARVCANNHTPGQEAALSLAMMAQKAGSKAAGCASPRISPTVLHPTLPNGGRWDAMEPHEVLGRDDVINSASQEISKMRIDMDEVQHRVKNMVAIIQSISHQTMRQSTTKSDFDERFCARLSAFCHSLDLLIANNWRGVGIHELVRSQLTIFGALDSVQISIEGPDLRVAPEAAHTIGLALHELAMNAVKYGSLSVPQGRVVVNWELANSKSRRRFHMSWSELGGPIVTEPKRRGFGRQLIQQLAALTLKGTATHEFLAKGVTLKLDVPASAVLARLATVDSYDRRQRLG